MRSRAKLVNTIKALVCFNSVETAGPANMKLGTIDLQLGMSVTRGLVTHHDLIIEDKIFEIRIS